MAIEGIFTIIISGLALLGSIYSIVVSRKYSKISVFHSLHEMILQKAMDCNSLFTEMVDEKYRDYWPGYLFTPTISEVIISVQLLDNSLSHYLQEKKRDFYLRQFWIQLQPRLRKYFKEVKNSSTYTPTAIKQLETIQAIFGKYFKDY